MKNIFFFLLLFLTFTSNPNPHFSQPLSQKHQEEKIIKNIECLKQHSNILFKKEKQIILLKEKINILNEKINFLNKKIKILQRSQIHTKNTITFDPFFLINSGANFYSKDPIPFIGISVGIIFRSSSP